MKGVLMAEYFTPENHEVSCQLRKRVCVMYPAVRLRSATTTAGVGHRVKRGSSVGSLQVDSPLGQKCSAILSA